MSSLVWKTEFCTGIEEMDNQHKKFLDYLRQLEEVAGGSKGMEVIEVVLKQVDNYIRYHFTEEEKLLKIAGYPELGIQKKDHEFFISQIKELWEGYLRGDAHIPVSTLEFLRDWFLRHILESDKKYGDYLSKVKG